MVITQNNCYHKKLLTSMTNWAQFLQVCYFMHMLWFIPIDNTGVWLWSCLSNFSSVFKSEIVFVLVHRIFFKVFLPRIQGVVCRGPTYSIILLWQKKFKVRINNLQLNHTQAICLWYFFTGLGGGGKYLLYSANMLTHMGVWVKTKLVFFIPMQI